jgi:adenylylsulfate kinase
MAEHIHPIYERLIDRNIRCERLGQQSKVIWLTGLSGSGKSTIAQHLEQKLFQEGFFAQVLDGDNIRDGINQNLGFSSEDRNENIRRIAEVAKLYLNSGIITINSFISPTIAIRKMAAEIVGQDSFIEIYVNAPIEVCESRDVKGLYAKARKGLIKDFTGIDAPYEPPLQPELEVCTDQMDIYQATELIFEFLLPNIKLK